MTLHYFSVHGHFYQPPRENPMTGEIPEEDGAKPYLNWNEKIHAECYRPNAQLGNFSHISFNLGPTLVGWMSRHNPETLTSILHQNRLNVQQHGVGNAIAQAYNHTIMPLASYQDKVTQIYWGISDFEHYFGNKPTGMWLPETGVDLETLTVLADHGIEFTILAAWQAQKREIDVTEPYRVNLGEGKYITVFFYHPELSAGVSFNPELTVNADRFARYILARDFNQEKNQRREPQFLLLASDGELYGHHQPLREMFLARLLDGAGSQAGLVNSYPALWLKEHPVRNTIEIREKTSWSCHHGLKRWTGECSCTPLNGSWKSNMRRAFNRLSVKLDRLYFEEVSGFVAEPWALRHEYIHVILGQMTLADLIGKHVSRQITDDEYVKLALILESQRERQRMFTSCGWFFEDFSRIEPQNNVAYATQAIHLADLASGVDLGYGFMTDLRKVQSMKNGLRGDTVYMRYRDQIRKKSKA